jgi:hypothetical protein
MVHPFNLSNISPPIFTQPLPDILPLFSAQQIAVNPLSQISLPSLQIKEPKPTFCGPSASDCTASSRCPSPTSEFSTGSLLHDLSPNPDFYGLSSDQPPSSAFPSEASSAQTSDSELPLSSTTQAKKQTGLLDFFSKVPTEELNARWRKRKRDNEERDKEEYAERKRRGDAEVLQKKAHRCEQNRTAQSRRHEKLRKMPKAELQENTEQESSVGLLSYIQLH